MFHSNEQWTWSSKTKWFKFMMRTPWSSCKTCLCWWPSDSHDLVSLKNAPSQQTSVLFFPVIIPNVSSLHFITTWLLCPLMLHPLECFLIFGQQKIIMRDPGHYFPSCSRASKGDTNSLFSVNRTWGGAWEGQESHNTCNPPFQISSPVGSGSFYTCVYTCELL